MKQFYLKIKNYLCNIPSDKYLHAIVSLALVQFLFYPCCIISKHIGPSIAILIAMGIGFIKELIDKYVMHESIDRGDLEADFCGIAIGTLLMLCTTSMLLFL